MLKAAAGEKTSEEDKKKAAIEAAMARVKAKREKQHAAQANIDHLTETQKKAIAEVEARRAKAREKQQAQIEESKKESGKLMFLI